MAAEASKSHFLSGKKIIVAGAGLAGLSFAASLRKQWDPAHSFPGVIICDRDSRELSTNREGYSLALSGADQNGGLYALMQMGMLDQITPHSVTGTTNSGSFKLWTPKWREVIGAPGRPAPGLPIGIIRIARRDLRRVMTEHVSAEPNEFRWSTTCQSCTVLPDGRVRVHMRDEEADRKYDEECDLLIAADGSSSKLRASLRPHDVLQYTGAVFYGGITCFPDGVLPPPVDIHWGSVASDRGCMFFASPMNKNEIVWTMSFLREEPLEPLDASDEVQVNDMLEKTRNLGIGIAEPFLTLVNNTTPSSAFHLNARDKSPFPHDESLGGVIFIGDSNHAVSPFAGNGANMALKDGWDLAEKICRESSLKSAISAYDKLSVPRASRSFKTSHSRIFLFHSTGLRYWLTITIMTGLGWMVSKFA
ncbi:hypothetical protein BX600DRAFT_515072 [Xylariales sp. PMI_506]|nr:hypothetical protein BX600DRAFT_515072 [Xylariales sp. PMI_506]